MPNQSRAYPSHEHNIEEELTLGQTRNPVLLGHVHSHRSRHNLDSTPPDGRSNLLVGDLAQWTYHSHTAPGFLGDLANGEPRAVGNCVEESDGM